MEDFIDDFDDDFGDICKDEFNTIDAVILGSTIGWVNEEGLEEAERKKLEKKMNSNREQNNNHP